ncbi:protein of unknown function (plasmid) [Pararobbsia alpina]
MTALAVIEHPHVLQQPCTRLLTSFVVAVHDQLIFKLWKKLSMGALSQQLPLRLMLWRIECRLSSSL